MNCQEGNLNKQYPLLLAHAGPSQGLTAVTMVMWICHENWLQYTAMMGCGAHTGFQLTAVTITKVEKTWN